MTRKIWIGLLIISFVNIIIFQNLLNENNFQKKENEQKIHSQKTVNKEIVREYRNKIKRCTSDELTNKERIDCVKEFNSKTWNLNVFNRTILKENENHNHHHRHHHQNNDHNNNNDDHNKNNVDVEEDEKGNNFEKERILNRRKGHQLRNKRGGEHRYIVQQLDDDKIILQKNETYFANYLQNEMNKNDDNHNNNDDHQQSVTRNDLVIAIVGYKRKENLRYLLDSLALCNSLNQTKIFISLDGYLESDLDDSIEEVISEYIFTNIQIIYHPYSHHFDKESLIKEHIHTAAKHHYWWLWHHLWSLPDQFDNIIFLEEDVVLLSDVFDIIDSLIYIRDYQCNNDCLSISLHSPHVNMGKPREHFLHYVYNGVFQSLAYILNRSVFNSIHSNSLVYCGYNDYNWDWTIRYMAYIGLLPKKSVTILFSRVFHTGVCGGMHFNTSTCDQLKKAFKEHELSEIAIRGNPLSTDIQYLKNSWFTFEYTWKEFEGWLFSRGEWETSFHRDHCLLVASSYDKDVLV